jgi:hypothetical protein
MPRDGRDHFCDLVGKLKAENSSDLKLSWRCGVVSSSERWGEQA